MSYQTRGYIDPRYFHMGKTFSRRVERRENILRTHREAKSFNNSRWTKVIREQIMKDGRMTTKFSNEIHR